MGIAAVALCMAVAVSGCTRAPDDMMLKEAFLLCEDLQYEAALPLIRAYLTQNPRSTVGHYLLGKYYQHRDEPALTLAKGQFDMARHLFDVDGDLSILEEVMTAREYQATLHCDSALVLLRTTIEAEEAGVPQQAALPILRAARDHARKARYFNPQSAFIVDLANTLETMVDAISEPTPPEDEPAPAPELPSPGAWEI